MKGLILLLVGVHMSQAQASLNLHLPNINIVLDPHKLEEAYSMTVASQVWRGLFHYKSDGEIEPELASDWKYTSKGSTLEVTLKPLTFSGGSRITPENVAASIGRVIALQSLIAADLNYLIGTEKFLKSGDLKDLGVRPKGKNKVEFVLKAPNALILHHLASPDCAILPITDYRADFAAGPKTEASGPYLILSADPKKVVIKKWREQPSDSSSTPDQITFFTSAAAPFDLARRAETDSLDKDSLSAAEEAELLALGWTRTVTEVVSERFVIADPKTISERTRRYLLAKTDPKQLVYSLQNTKLLPAWGPIPPGLPGALSEAERLLIRQEMETTPEKGELTLEYADANPINERIVNALIDQWKHPLLTLRKKPLSPTEYFDALFNRKASLLLGAKGIDYFEGFSIVGYFRGGNPSNYYRVNDPKIDLLLDRAISQLDVSLRLSAYQEIQRQVLRKSVLIPLISGSTASGLWSPNVELVPAHPLGIHSMPFEAIRIKISKPRRTSKR
jgi:ABC-type transport system substrate-binding protein